MPASSAFCVSASAPKKSGSTPMQNRTRRLSASFVRWLSGASCALIVLLRSAGGVASLQCCSNSSRSGSTRSGWRTTVLSELCSPVAASRREMSARSGPQMSSFMRTSSSTRTSPPAATSGSIRRRSATLSGV